MNSSKQEQEDLLKVDSQVALPVSVVSKVSMINSDKEEEWVVVARSEMFSKNSRNSLQEANQEAVQDVQHNNQLKERILL